MIGYVVVEFIGITADIFNCLNCPKKPDNELDSKIFINLLSKRRSDMSKPTRNSYTKEFKINAVKTVVFPASMIQFTKFLPLI